MFGTSLLTTDLQMWKGHTEGLLPPKRNPRWLGASGTGVNMPLLGCASTREEGERSPQCVHVGLLKHNEERPK